MKKVSDEAIVAAYVDAGSCRKAALIVGLSPQTVHSRLVKLGKNRKVRVFTESEKFILMREYEKYADAGHLDDLAKRMGRTKHYLCRKARDLGLTSRRRRCDAAAKYRHIGRDEAEQLLTRLEAFDGTLRQFAETTEYSANGLWSFLLYHFEERFMEEMERRRARNWKYAAGRRFEYRVRDHLIGLGAFCMRSPGSKSPVDILAVYKGVPLFVQCKVGPWHEVDSWNAFIDLARSHGAMPIFATRQGGRKLSLYIMDQKKDGSRRPLNLQEWNPAQQGRF